MTRERFVPCPSCRAHVRASELRTCPFCSEQAASSFGVRGGVVLASLLAFSACAGEAETPPNDNDGSGGEVVDGQGEDGGSTESQTEEPTEPTVIPEDSPQPPPAAAYGGPPEPINQPLYGIPAN